MIFKNLHLIVAITEKTNAIGKDGNLIYFLKEDMEFFKEKTYNNSIICGRKTFESFKIKPLPKRKNIVITKSNFNFKDVLTFNSFETLFEFIKNNPKEKFLVCGGSSIYKELMPYCSKMFITKFQENEDVIADSFFPKIDENIWKITKKIDGISINPKLSFYTYERINKE